MAMTQMGGQEVALGDFFCGDDKDGRPGIYAAVVK